MSKEYSQQSEIVEEEQEAIESALPRAAEGPAQPPASASEDTASEDYKEKARDYWDQLLRLQAEFSNYRKRTEKEKSDAIRFGKELIVEKMVSLLDVMEEALKHSQNAAESGGSNVDSLQKGFEMVVREFERFLKLEGVEPLPSVGEFFDPHRHEAVEQIATDQESENNIVVEEIQKGYFLNGRLLRPARVKVAKLKKS